MRIPALPLIASIALFAAPALAQTSGAAAATQPNGGSAHAYSNNANDQNQGTNGPQNSQQYGESSQRGQQRANDQNQGMRGSQNSQRYGESSQQNQKSAEAVTQNTQRMLRESLLRNGFRDVNVEPQTYVIHAQAPDGSHIVMMVGPEQVSGVVMGSNNNNNGSEANRSMQNGSSNWNQGGMNGTSNTPNESGQNGSSNWNQGGTNR